MGLFIDEFTLFSWSLFDLAVPDLGAWLEVLSSHMRTDTVTSITSSTYIQCYKHYYKHDKAVMTMYISSGTLFLFHLRGSVGLTGLEYFGREHPLRTYIKLSYRKLKLKLKINRLLKIQKTQLRYCSGIWHVDNVPIVVVSIPQ
jgi:hypothetical protein